MQRKIIIWIISIYKILASLLRVLAGSILLYFSCSIEQASLFLFRKELLEDPADFLFRFLTGHIMQASTSLTCILASALIVLSLADIFFIIALLYRRRWGAIGFFIVSILWVPIEILFVSRFLVIPKTLALIIDFIIIYFLYKLITHPKGYFVK